MSIKGISGLGIRTLKLMLRNATVKLETPHSLTTINTRTS